MPSPVLNLEIKILLRKTPQGTTDEYLNNRFFLQKMDIEADTSSIPDEPEVFLDLHRDPRVQWFKERILTFIGMDDEELFYNMFEGDARQKFIKFITSALKPNELSMDKRTFYVAKFMVDKLIHVDKEFTEWSKY